MSKDWLPKVEPIRAVEITADNPLGNKIVNDLRTLSRAEKELAHLLQVAESNAALAEAVGDLPASMTGPVGASLLSSFEQGFDAGYMAACKKVLAVITKMKEAAK